MLIDVSHMNEKAFWDTARHSSSPLVATHSNAHTLCPQPRNLTDRQLLAIRDSGGVAGVNFGNAFCAPTVNAIAIPAEHNRSSYRLSY